MQIFNELMFLSLIVVPPEILICTESSKVTSVLLCFVFIRDQPMWFTKPIMSAEVREDKLLVPGADFEAAQFG